MEHSIGIGDEKNKDRNKQNPVCCSFFSGALSHRQMQLLASSQGVPQHPQAGLGIGGQHPGQQIPQRGQPQGQTLQQQQAAHLVQQQQQQMLAQQQAAQTQSQSHVQAQKEDDFSGHALNISSLLSSQFKIVEPGEDVVDNIHFIFNNLTQANLEAKSRELVHILKSGEVHDYFAFYLVVKRASLEENYHEVRDLCLFLNFS